MIFHLKNGPDTDPDRIEKFYVMICFCVSYKTDNHQLR